MTVKNKSDGSQVYSGQLNRVVATLVCATRLSCLRYTCEQSDFFFAVNNPAALSSRQALCLLAHMVRVSATTPVGGVRSTSRTPVKERDIYIFTESESLEKKRECESK